MTKHRAVNYDDALSQGLIPDADGSETNATDAPFQAITTWYGDGEGRMLGNALKQLGDVEVLIVRRNGESRLYRPKGQVKCDG